MAVGLTHVIPAWGQTAGLVVLLLNAPDYADLPAQLHPLGSPAACLSVTPAHVQLHSQLEPGHRSVYMVAEWQWKPVPVCCRHRLPLRGDGHMLSLILLQAKNFGNEKSENS